MLRHAAHRRGNRGRSPLAALLAASLLAATTACGGGDSGGAGGQGGAAGGGGSSSSSRTSTSATPASSTSTGSVACDPDTLKTGLAPLFNGYSVDMDDCPVLEFTAKYNEPDAMIFKAIIYVESRFQPDAVGCTGNSGCCPQDNWTDMECGCLGSMQTGPACGGSGLGLLPDGHPDLDDTPGSADWANSVFNPEVNVELGIFGINGNRAQVEQQYPGCTEEQYTMMAIGNFNSYGSTQSCTVYNFDYDNEVLDAYDMYAAAANWPARTYR